MSSDTPPVRLPPFSAFGRNRRTAEPAQSLSASATTVEVSRVDPIELLVWKPSVLNVHGFGCVFQFACSMLNKASNDKKPLFIELNCTNSLYDSFRTPKVAAGWWSDIFEQPYAVFLRAEPEKVKRITEFMQRRRENPQYSDSAVQVELVDPPPAQLEWNHSGVWGVAKDAVGLSEHKVVVTRTLFHQNNPVPQPLVTFSLPLRVFVPTRAHMERLQKLYATKAFILRVWRGARWGWEDVMMWRTSRCAMKEKNITQGLQGNGSETFAESFFIVFVCRVFSPLSPTLCSAYMAEDIISRDRRSDAGFSREGRQDGRGPWARW